MREHPLALPVDKLRTANFIHSTFIEESVNESIDGNSDESHHRLKGVNDDSHSKQSALELFSDLSLQLTESYSLLENRVSDLTSELNSVSEQRILELKDKEKIANRLENLINFLPGGIVVLDNRGLIVESNPAAEEMLDNDLRGQRWREVIKQCFSPKNDDGHEVSNHKGQRINIATRSLGKDGQIILLTDQTETRQLQAQLSRHERLTALGKMVSTLAHQVRTPLSSAILYGSHLLDTSLTKEQQQQFSKKLVNRLHEMERQVRDMLLFVKPELMISQQLLLGELQQALEEGVDELCKQHNIQCEWQIEQPETPILCNKDALVGALSNLLHNSVQAMNDVEHTDSLLSVEFECQENHIVITIKDNGCGIKTNHPENIHDLFVTTKSQGTGIGLSVVHSVAKAHGGIFTLESLERGGAIALLRLPIINLIER